MTVRIPAYAFHCDDRLTWEQARAEACRLCSGRTWHVYIRSHKHHDHWHWGIYVS